jgi:hypothetical protein
VGNASINYGRSVGIVGNLREGDSGDSLPLDIAPIIQYQFNRRYTLGR